MVLNKDGIEKILKTMMPTAKEVEEIQEKQLENPDMTLVSGIASRERAFYAPNSQHISHRFSYSSDFPFRTMGICSVIGNS